MTTLNITRDLATQLHAIRAEGLDETAKHQAKRCLLDYIGASLGGVGMVREKVLELLQLDEPGAQSASVIGFGTKASVQTAAWLNGITSHVAEMDDGVRFGMIHPGSPVLSALLPAAERFQVDAEDLLVGIVVGYEAALRLATSIQPSHYGRGYHPTATCGSIGAAAGIGAMLNFTAEKIEHAIATAGVTASGTLKVIGEGSELKPYNTAHAASSGLMAAMMTRAGFTGPEDALAGRGGFLSMCSEACDTEKIIKFAPDGLWIHKVYVKPYAACRHAHPAMEACLKLREKLNIQPEDVREINIVTYGGLAGRHDQAQAQSVSAAKMSIPCSVAIAMVSGAGGVASFTEDRVQSEQVRSLAMRVHLVEDPALTAQVPNKRTARVTLVMQDHAQETMEVIYPKGEPENPMTDIELEHKFLELAEFGGLSFTRAQIICRQVWDLKQSLSKLFAIL